MRRMREDKPTPVRLGDLADRAAHAAEKLGFTGKSSIIKLCLSVFLDDFEKRGVAALPLDWREILESHDRRRAPGIVAEANGHGSTVIVNHGVKTAHYTKSKPKKRKG